MEDLHNVGGVPAVLKFMLDNDMLHPDYRQLLEKLSQKIYLM